MPSAKSDIKMRNNQKKMLKKQIPDSDSDSDYETISDEHTTDSSYDEDEDGESESDEISLGSQDTDEDEEDETSKDTEDVEDADDEDQPTPEEVRKTISKIFPSKYMSKKVKADEKKSKKLNKKQNKKRNDDDDDDSESEDDSVDSSLDRKRHNTRSKSSKKSKAKKAAKKRQMDSDSESDLSETDLSEIEEEFDNNDRKNINIILGFGPGGQEEDDEYMEDEYALRDEEDCDSDDEKTFMKETYQHVEIPEELSTEITTKKTKKNGKSKNNKNKSPKKGEEAIEDASKFDAEYAELIDMKKYLVERLKKNPNSKMWIKSLKECNNSIKKLVKKERGNNTKEYHKMINSQNRKFTSEIDYFKRKLSKQEQQKAIMDLKVVNEHMQIDKPYRLSILESKLPTKYKATVLQKLNILRSMQPGDPEYCKMKNWIDTFMRIPFGIYRTLNVNLSDGAEACKGFMERSIKILDDCVYGMNDAKMQVIQMVGQWITNPSAMGTAIAIKGSPGTGKTSLVKEGISKILGREFAFIALGGAGDSSFLEGHSYTYEGSSWGKIIQILIDSKCMNPVIYFDELDKLSESTRGAEITGILTHLTDTSQNSEFHDKYFSEVSFDLSKCLFIFSYNDESKVNPILRDRMYRIQTKGYSAKEKIIIAKNFILPKIREQVNFDEGMINIPDDVIEYIITKPAFTKNEEGVRNLKRCLEIIYTKLNLFRLIKHDNELFSKEINLKVEFPYTVTKKDADLLIKDDEATNTTFLNMYI